MKETMMKRNLLRFTMSCAMTLTGLSGSAIAQDLPDGPGKAALVKVCGSCHGVDYIDGLKHTKAEWQAVVDSMIGRGAMATDEEVAAIVGYLTKNFGRGEGQLQRIAARRAAGNAATPATR